MIINYEPLHVQPGVIEHNEFVNKSCIKLLFWVLKHTHQQRKNYKEYCSSLFCEVVTAPEIKYMRITAGYTWTDYKTNTQIAKELKITPILDKLLEYKRNWIQHVNRIPCNRLPRVMKHYSLTGRRNHGRPLKRLLDTRDWNGSSGPTP
jgi:hypothetical protein